MSARLKHILWALSGVGVAAVVFWALWERGGPNGSAAVGVTSPAHAALAKRTASRETVGVSQSADDDTVQAPVEPLDASALRALCGRPWEAVFSAECMKALERRYRDTIPDGEHFDVGFTPVMLGEPVTWGQVFNDVALGLESVREAVARPECLVPEGRFRLDLRRDCAADEMARLAILRRACARLLSKHDEPVDVRQERWDRAVARARGIVDQTEYYQRLERLHEDSFRKMWRLAKCRALPEGTLEQLGPFIRPHTKVPRVDGVYIGRGAITIEVDMIQAAARLGSDWALSSVLRMPWAVLKTGDQGIEDVRERPVLAELLRMRRAVGVEQMMHAYVAERLGVALGVQVHPDGVAAFTGVASVEDNRAAWRLAAPRLIALGWTLVVDHPAAAAPRRFEKREDILGDEPWFEWDVAGRIRMVATE